jgi:hypothetical protein
VGKISLPHSDFYHTKASLDNFFQAYFAGIRMRVSF